MSEQKSTAGANNQEDFSPRKFLVQLDEIRKAVSGRWLFVFMVASVFGISAAAYCLFKKPVYHAEITFALDEGASPGSRSELSILSEDMGFTTGNMEAGGVFSNVPNIMELLQSRLLIEKTLRKEVIQQNKSATFADMFLDSLDYRKKWLRNEQPISFKTKSGSGVDTLRVNGILRNMHDLIIKKYLKIETRAKGSTIISASILTENETFSKLFLEELINDVTQYYIETKTQRSKITLEYISKRADSTRNAYNNSLTGRAIFTDANINPGRQVATVPGIRKETDVQILRTSYMELVGSLEAAKTALMRNTPLFQFLDIPILPLKKSSPSPVKYFILFFIVGLLLSCGWIVAHFVFRRIMNN